MNKDVDVYVISHKNEANEKLNHAMKMIIEEWAMKSTGYAQNNVPVDTGNLRNSLSRIVDVENQTAGVGTNVEYAPYVEFNEEASHPSGKAHFMRDAIVTHTDEYRSIAEKYLKSM